MNKNREIIKRMFYIRPITDDRSKKPAMQASFFNILIVLKSLVSLSKPLIFPYKH